MFITDQHRAKIKDYFSDMNHYIHVLEEVKKTTQEDFLAAPILQAAAERALHIALESATDVGNLLIDALVMRDPSSYEDIIQVLAEEEVFPAAFSASFLEAVRYRRVLAHDYAMRDSAQLYDLLQKHTHEFARFQEYVAHYVKLGNLADNKR